MSFNDNKSLLPYGEFVGLMALMMALAALSTDAMLPALSDIGQDLGVQQENSRQLIVSLLFLGLAVGQIIYGPLSDSIGRKPTIYAGYGLYMVGCLFAIFSRSFPIMLVGRVLQGVGIAGPRSVSMALVRDQYQGRTMARVMSIVMAIFIIVPAVAPSFGQAILLIAHWRAIFGSFLLIAVITLIWFGIRQPETLPKERRIPFSGKSILKTAQEVFSNRVSLGYTLCAGLISGAFLGYLNSAQQILQEQYGLGTRFPLYFGAISLALGTASFSNSKLVMRFGMRAISKWALFALTGLSITFLTVSYLLGGNPPLAALMVFFMMAFFCVGLLFGNLNSIAMGPLGRIAGMGAAVVGSLSTFMQVPLGTLIGQSYNGTILPLVSGFAILGTLTIFVMRWAEGGRKEDAYASL